MFYKEFDAVKRYFNFYRVKKFIQVSLVSYSLPVLFEKELKREFWFYVDYKRLIVLLKKIVIQYLLLKRHSLNLKVQIILRKVICAKRFDK